MNVININDISTLHEKSIVTVGMFDGLHMGHQHILGLLLSHAREYSLKPVVVTFDRHPRVVLGLTDHNFHQLQTTDERLASLERCGVPEVAMVSFTPEVAQWSACTFAREYLCRRLNMQRLLLGYDNLFGNKKNNDFERLPALAADMGFAIESDSAVQVEGCVVSSTSIRKLLDQGDIEMCNRMLGRHYELSGLVVHGRHVGRTIGFPTANIELPDPFKAFPMPGVYAVVVDYEGRQYRGMANIGPRPTFAVEKFAIEVHLLDFDGDLYGKVLRVFFHKRLRDIVRFNTVDELVSQLHADRDAIRQIININSI